MYQMTTGSEQQPVWIIKLKQYCSSYFRYKLFIKGSIDLVNDSMLRIVADPFDTMNSHLSSQDISALRDRGIPMEDIDFKSCKQLR
jgi:hypothetical protein